MRIVISSSSGEPIYEQIKKQIVSQIASGALSPGEALPSIRFTAKELGVGIITVKRAYDDLCADGWGYSLQGKGVFVSGAGADARQKFLREIKERADELVRYAASGGVGRGELLKIIGDEGGDGDERSLDTRPYNKE